MHEQNIHDKVIREWRSGWTGTLDHAALLDVFERALDALWRRAHMSLGEMTLMAIVDRVIHQGCEKFPHLTLLRVETSRVRFGDLAQSASALDRARLEESLVFVVYELLRVFGTLTGEILTPGLHAELRKMRVPSADTQGG